MTEFKVGDKVVFEGSGARYLYDEIGLVPGDIGVIIYPPDGPYPEAEKDGAIVRWVRAGKEVRTMFKEMRLFRTLAEKRQDDFKVLEEASRPWRNAPDYYKFPHDVQTTDISMHLNSNGGQAVGYISRSTRIDGQNKEDDPRESLRKAIDLIQMEIYRLDEKFGV